MKGKRWLVGLGAMLCIEISAVALIWCKEPLVATFGVKYDVSADGTYAEVVGYRGTPS